MRPTLRGAAALLAAPALLLPALVVTATPAQAAVDPAPATAAGTWLAGKVPSTGVFVTSGEFDGEPYSYDDYGLSIDVGVGLLAAGGHDEAVARIVAGLESNIDAYTAPGFGTEVAAGATAKSLAFLQDAGGDAGLQAELLGDLESTVLTEGANAGRIQDQLDPEDPWAADYANVFGQAPAVRALDDAGSSLTDAATDFLLAQQCADGYFRQSFSPVGDEAQGCDAAGGKPDVDATALAVVNLQSQLDDTDVSAAVAAATEWLVEEQKANGGFGSNADLPAANANSTGAAGYALQLAGEDEAAAHAAAWLRAHQATIVANCVYYDEADLGAVAYDDAALAATQGGPMDSTLEQQAVRAGSDAVVGLLAAQTGAGEPRAIFTAEYVKAGTRPTIGVSAAPGEAVCAMLGEQSVLAYGDVDGDAELRVRVPAGTSEVSVANADGVFDTVEVDALGKQRLGVAVAKKRVAKGAKQTVTVRELAPGETATVKVGATTVQAQANGKGVLKARFTVTGKPGRKTVKVTGAFKNRAGSAQYTVTR